MVAAGALIACWYALLAALRHLLAAGFWLSLAADVAFGVGAAAIFCGALCAAGLFPPARRAATAVGKAFRHSFVKLRSFRWIKVIFR